MDQRQIPFQLKITARKAHQLADASIPQEVRSEVTEGQGRVIGFLFCNQHRSVYQRDVEAEFSISRATASKMLTAMEQAGLIRRSAVAGDARLKKLELTEKSMTHIRQIHAGIAEMEQKLTRGLTAEEQKTLLHLLQKVEQNAETALTQLRSGKETTEC